MVEEGIRCVVGIDVANRSHLVCALDAATAKPRQRPQSIAANADGYAQLRTWLTPWGTPQALLIGLEATGCLWEPLYDTLTRAG